jgi:APA family basic amino acid/polyamine antiporter
MTQILDKKLTLFGLTMIAVGSCIGSGIFITPAQIVKDLPNATLVLLVWVLGGIIALTGALTFSELGGLFPKSGGVYVFLKEAYGELTGFLYGWIILLVINTGALAGLCVAFAEYLKLFAPHMTEATKTIIAAATMLILTAVNILGVSISQSLANVFTILKLIAIVAIIAAGFAFFDPEKVQLNFSVSQGIPQSLTTSLLTGLIGVLFSVGGWHHASYVAGEAKNAGSTVPRAMFYGVMIVVTMYLLVNLAYMMLLPLPVIAETPRVAGDAIATLAPWGGMAVAVAIALSIFGTVSIYTMSAPRIYYAMAADGIFFKKMAEVHPSYHTPVWAMIIQVVWAMAILFFFSGLFDRIITFVTFMDIAFMGLAGASIFVFRKKLSGQSRPVIAWGYPVVPVIFVVISVAFAFNVIMERPSQAIPGLVLLLAGIVAYFIFKRTSKPSDVNSIQ